MAGGVFCDSPLFVNVRPNTSIWEALTPCLSFVGAPAVANVLITLTSIVMLAIYFIYHRQSPSGRKLAVNALIYTKTAISLVFGCVAICQALIAFVLTNRPMVEFRANTLSNLMFAMFALGSYRACIQFGIVSLGVLHLAWLAKFVAMIPTVAFMYHALDQPFYHYFEANSGLAIPIFWTQILYLLGSAVMVILLGRADSIGPNRYTTLRDDDIVDATDSVVTKQVWPESSVSSLSSLFLWYASPIIRKGLSTNITYDDIWALERRYCTSYLARNFESTAVGYSAKKLRWFSVFLWRLVRCSWELLFVTVAIVVTIVVLKFLSAILLRIIVNSVQDSHPLWYSLLALLTLYAVNMTQNILSAKRDYLSFMSYSNLRSALLFQIFMKMLRFSAASRAKYSTGEVMNIVTTDIQRLRLFWFQLRDFFYCPLIIIVSLAGLFFMIGLNTAYGIVVLIFILPANYFISKKMTDYEQYQMTIKDSRLKLVNDMLSGMKVLKLYAWEEPMQRMIGVLRAKELSALRKIFFLDGIITVSFQFGPALALFVSLYGYTVIDGNVLMPDIAFVSLMFFLLLRYALCQLPNIIANGVKAFISGRRVLQFLNEAEQHRLSHIQRRLPRAGEPVVLFEKCTYTWGISTLNKNEKKADKNSQSQTGNGTSNGNGSDHSNGNCNSNGHGMQAGPSAVDAHLINIGLKVQRGELIGVVGRVGSGKSSLLSAILGEMDCLESRRAVVHAQRISYVPQQTWIQNKTLRKNITFEKPFNDLVYQRTINACLLTDDLKLLRAGDMTEIGEKGINLSGGQRARVSLARAIYQEADLYILDDVLSAVDSYVGAQIFENVIGPKGLLRDTTRIFALNSLSFLKDCDRIVVMNDGRIHEIGTFTKLMEGFERNAGGPFTELMREYLEKQTKQATDKKEHQNDINEDPISSTPFTPPTPSVLIPQEFSVDACSMPGHISSISPVLIHQQVPRMPVISPRQSVTSHSPTPLAVDNSSNGNNNATPANLGRLIEEEEMATGMVSRVVYLNYIKAFGVGICSIFLLTIIGSSVSEAISNVWLAKWTSEAKAVTPGITNLGVYGLFGLITSLLTGASMLFMAFGAYFASVRFHDDIVHSLLRAPMSFFDRTPLGRIINRLSTDIDRIDENIPFCFSYTFFIIAGAVNAVMAIVIVIPALIIIVVPLFIIFAIIMYYFTKASVQFRRLTSTAMSKCFAFVQDAYTGSDSIRAYDVTASLGQKVGALVDLNTECVLTEILSNRWIQIRLDVLANTTIFIFILVAIVLGNQNLLSIGSLALVINSGINFSSLLGEIARMCREVEVQIVGVERVQEYISIDSEAEWRYVDSAALAKRWPLNGGIRFEDFRFRYRPDADLVLKDLCFDVPGGTKVGIVGRTGAGKSSITMALFRIVEPEGGRILIDDVDITEIGLHDLRKVLTIIPQDPVLFCGTIRSNLDPFEEFEDAELWSAIERANLRDFVSNQEKGLLYEISEGGNNLSVGQRQLVCLARALLRSHSTRILILDEATAAIDPKTDRLIQLSIREHFHSCTILTIAHRLNTVIDYDRILVMDAGRVAEYDTPQWLLANEKSIFTSLCRHAGITETKPTKDH